RVREILLLADLLALVALLLAAAEAQLDLRDAVFEVNLERQEGEARYRELSVEPLELPAVQEQLALSAHVVALIGAGLQVGSDVHLVQEELLAVECRVGPVEVRAFAAQALHLGAEEHHPGLEALFDLEALRRLRVARDDETGAALLTSVVWLGHGPSRELAHSRAPRTGERVRDRGAVPGRRALRRAGRRTQARARPKRRRSAATPPRWRRPRAARAARAPRPATAARPCSPRRSPLGAVPARRRRSGPPRS